MDFGVRRMVNRISLFAAVLLSACAGSWTSAESPNEALPEALLKNAEVVSLEVVPNEIVLSHRFDYRQTIVYAQLSNGLKVDVTRAATSSFNEKLVLVTSEGVVTPIENGTGKIAFSFRDKSASAQLSVEHIAEPRTVSFVQDVQPALSKLGCNQGTCHGSKEGKNGFKLSLRGYDPIYDHRALTDDIRARRFNRASPDDSLILLKSTGSIPHVGGARTQVGASYYNLLRDWIAQGVKLDLDRPRVAKIEVQPENPVIALPGMRQQITVLATYTDGTKRDVTREAFIESGNIETLEASPSGVVTTLRRGEAPVLVRYEGAYAATTLTIMGDRTGFEWKPTETYGEIDGFVYNKLEKLKILPSGVCTDEEFARRIYLDLTGLPPTIEELNSFLQSSGSSREKREKLIDRLIGGRGFVEHWTNKWSDLLQVNRKFLGEQGSMALRDWIRDAVATNMPYDQFAHEILTAAGSTIENPPAAYYKVLRDPESAMENTTHLFLAVRFNCNKCHDHPFERWTQDQYYKLAAYFAQVGRKEDPEYSGQRIGGSAVEGAAPLVEIVYDSGVGEVTHNRTGKQTMPDFPYGRDGADSKEPRRERLARWLASKENQYFAKSYVNRLWGYLFGTGIIEPIDDIRAGNPPSNPELLDYLTSQFIESGFDTQHVIRLICKSRVYQHSVRTNVWNFDDTSNYSHAIPRRLPAETLYDAIYAATGARSSFAGLPNGFRAAELPDAGVSDPFLDDFGRPVRESACECERSTSMVLGPVLKLINGPTVAGAIQNPENALAKIAQDESDDHKAVEQVFLRFLSRKPTESELRLGLEAMQQAGDDHAKLLAKLEDREQRLRDRQVEWERGLTLAPTWETLAFDEMKSQQGATFAKQTDGSILVSGPFGAENYVLTAKMDPRDITGIRLEAIPDESLPAKGPGRADNGNFVLSEARVSITSLADPSQKQDVSFGNATHTYSQDGFSGAFAFDGNEGTGWAVAGQTGRANEIAAETASPVRVAVPSAVTISLSQQYPDGKHSLGRFRVSITSSPRPTAGTKLPSEIASVVAKTVADRSESERAMLANYYRSQDSDYLRLQELVKRSEDQLKNKRLTGLQDLAWALVNNPAFLFNR